MEWIRDIPEDHLHELDSFRLFGLEPSLDVDTDLLETRYLKMTQWAHPDRNSDRADWAELLTARINQAHDQLDRFLARAEAYFQLTFPGYRTDDRSMPPGFLEQVFQWNERQEQGILEIDQVEDAYDEVIDRILELERTGSDPATFRQTLNQLKYFEHLIQAEELS